MDTTIAEISIAVSSIPKWAGELLMSVAVSNQMTDSTAPAIRKSLWFRSAAGKGRSRDTILCDSFANVPIGQSVHQNLANNKAPMISIGHPSAHPNRAAGFLVGSEGPRNRNARRMNRNGVVALWSIAG